MSKPRLILIESDTPENRRELQALHEARCIYKERDFIRAVSVTGVEIDDWGVKFILSVSEAQGFDDDERTTIHVSGGWDYLCVQDGRVSASPAGWLLVVRPDLVEKVMDYAPSAQHPVQLVEFINNLAYGDEVSRYFERDS